MRFLSQLFSSILRRNLLLYNFLVMISVLFVFFLIFLIISSLIIISVKVLSNAFGIAEALILEYTLVSLILPILVAIADFVFCFFLLIINLKLSRPEILD